MNFKRPYWLLMSISLGCLVPGYATIAADTDTPMAGQVNSVGDEVIKPASADELKAYERRPESYSPKEIMPIAIGYVYATNLPCAIAAYKRVLAAEPNNKRANRGLGGCYVLDKQFENAIEPLKKGSDMGDDQSTLELADVYCFFAINYQELKKIIPRIMIIRKQAVD